MKEIKCILLGVDTVLVTEVEAIEPENPGEPECEFTKPYEIDEDGELTPWPRGSEGNVMRVHSYNILTMVDAKADVVAKYKELTS